MLKLDGKTLVYDRAFSHNNINYPRNWLRLTSLEEKQAIGITEVADVVTPSYNQKFYWGVNNPKDHEVLVDNYISKVKETAGKLLQNTDWIIVRASDPSSNKEVPESTNTERALIRTLSEEKEVAIKATTTTAELEAYVTSSEFNNWESKAEPEPIPEPNEDTLSFTTGTTSASIIG